METYFILLLLIALVGLCFIVLLRFPPKGD